MIKVRLTFSLTILLKLKCFLKNYQLWLHTTEKIVAYDTRNLLCAVKAQLFYAADRCFPRARLHSPRRSKAHQPPLDARSVFFRSGSLSLIFKGWKESSKTMSHHTSNA